MGKNILITGGLGFIGSNFLCKYVPLYPEHYFVNLDAEKYAANHKYVAEISGAKNYEFMRANLAELNEYPINWADFDMVINFAALSHVGNSIDSSGNFIDVNIKGVYHILEGLRSAKSKHGKTVRLTHVSTDEVFGDYTEREAAYAVGDDEQTRYRPTNPYAATKGASDLLIHAYFKTYGLNVTITNCCNNYGPKQHEEKLIPKVLYNLMHGKPITMHGDGMQVRDWIHVIDHGDAVWTVANNAAPGSQFNVSGGNHRTNLSIVKVLYGLLSTYMQLSPLDTYLQFVSDRGYNDRKYFVNDALLRTQLGWEPKIKFDVGMKETVEYYYNKWKV